MQKVFLLVEPNDGAATVNTSLVERASPGATVLRARTGIDALAVLANERLIPSMILAEFETSDLGGLEFLSEIRQVRWLDRPPFAFLSAPIHDRTMVQAYRLGACAFLVKPATVHELREVIRDFARPAKHLAAAGVVPASSPAARVDGLAA
jgi:DNA-binding response OmpR family regulator